MSVETVEPHVTPTEVWSSYSGLNQHRKCPQQWLYAQSLYRPDTSPAPQRDFGSWWHAVRAADSIKRGRVHGSLIYCPDALRTTDDGPQIEVPAEHSFGPAAVIVAARTWWKAQPEEYRVATEAALGETLPQRLLSLFLSWRKRWADEIANERPLAVELRWTRVHRTADGNEMNLIGFVDEVYEDVKRGHMAVVRDHKTSTRMNAATSLDDLMDSQLHLYSWGAAPIVEKWGKKIMAVAYDRAQMVAPKPPTLTKSGRISVRMGQPSLSGTDLDTYLEWAKGPDGQGVPFEGLKKDGSGAGFYHAEESVIETLNQPEERSRWLQRTLTPLNRAIVNTHLRAACDTADDILRTKQRAEAVSEAGRNLGQACGWCDFASLCRAQMFGGPDGEYDLSEHNLKVRPKKTWP